MSTTIPNISDYTTAHLGLKVMLHEEGRCTLPAKMLAEVKAEIKARKAREIQGARAGIIEALGGMNARVLA